MHDSPTPTDRDYLDLAALHRTTLPTSVLGRLGHALVARYYRWVAASDAEQLFVIREGGAIAAAAVVSDSPETVLRRFRSSAAAAFAVALVRAAIGDGAFRRELRAYLRETIGAPPAAPRAPELTQIFVTPDRQSRSLGSQLLERVETHLRRRGVAAYYARTVVRENEPTLAFYRRRAFVPVDEVRFCGERYVLLKKSLSGAANQG